jgi:DNA-binding CsgD family transcriptional regulator
MRSCVTLAPLECAPNARRLRRVAAQTRTFGAVERETLSVRTVEGHIYSAMAKTGAADRDELAAMLPSTHDSNKLIR